MFSTEDNVARKGTATQSDTSHSGDASRAIDGNANTDWAGNSCTHTSAQKDPWWRVNLKDKSRFRQSTVTITNRADCCSERLSGAEIRIGSSLENNGNSNPLCERVGSAEGIKTLSVNCKGMVGQYVNIIIPGSGIHLTLCEVVICGSKESGFGKNASKSAQFGHIAWQY
uniref:fucolectin-like n=1 Tax=Pristiophorus japonicus TaxID=55135 RepID=UPI00398F5FB6